MAKLTMKEILNKYSDCDMFSLTGGIVRYNTQEKFKSPLEDYLKTNQINTSDALFNDEEILNDIKKLACESELEARKFDEQFLEKFNVTEKEFIDALNNIRKKDKEELRKRYEMIKQYLIGYPQFEELYAEIERECYEFKKNKCHSFISDLVGKTTKYGKEHEEFFQNFYFVIEMSIERQNKKEEYCISNGISPIENVPVKLKDYLLHYEISFYNQVTISGQLMINYYFSLNDETKEYLLKFKTDFDLNDLQDLALYNNGEVKFYSCTHEGYNSLDEYNH